MENINSEFYIIKSHSKLIRIKINKIFYISVKNNLLTFYLDDQKIFMYGTLRRVLEDLPNGFVKTEHHVLVNTSKIIEIDTHKRRVKLDGAIILPISCRRIKDVIRAVSEPQHTLTRKRVSGSS